ncbi:PagK family vesicle-borne virulence factor [Salmonella enterica]|uniref:PagK family vesicle-borne virulence factor n=1 Tax=Salmonella enterica TaxID=28901 RepID=UPI0034CE924A
MRHVKNIFLVLAFALSAAAFSTSAMAASDSKPPPDNTKHFSSGLPEIPWALIGMNQEWCKQYPPDILKPPDWCQICRC